MSAVGSPSTSAAPLLCKQQLRQRFHAQACSIAYLQQITLVAAQHLKLPRDCHCACSTTAAVIAATSASVSAASIPALASMTGNLSSRRRRSAGAFAARCALAVLSGCLRVCSAISAIGHSRNLCRRPAGLCQEDFDRMCLCARPKAPAIHPDLVLFSVLVCLQAKCRLLAAQPEKKGQLEHSVSLSTRTPSAASPPLGSTTCTTVQRILFKTRPLAHPSARLH